MKSQFRSLVEGYLDLEQHPPITAQIPSPIISPVNRWLLEGKSRLHKTFEFSSNEIRNGYLGAMFAHETLQLKRVHWIVSDCKIEVCIESPGMNVLTVSDKRFASECDAVYRDLAIVPWREHDQEWNFG